MIINWINDQIKNGLTKQFFSVLLVFQMLILFIICWYTNRLEIASFESGGDAPSYLLYPFDSLKEALSSHRTFGFSLILQTYNAIFGNLKFWPVFQILSYSMSILFLFEKLLKAKITLPIAFLFSSGLIWNPSTGGSFMHAETEVFTAIFLILTLALIFKPIQSNKNSGIVWLSLAIFCLYQIRPNMAFIIFLIPVWSFFVSQFLYIQKFKNSIYTSFKLFLFSFTPFFLFCTLRLILVGDFGVASFSGTVLSGQATSYLKDQHLQELDGETAKLAEMILAKKKIISNPCNKIEDLTYEEQQYCGNTHIMISWLSANKLIYGREPYSDPRKNIEPWNFKEKNLSSFFSVNNIKQDSLLKDYSAKILNIEKDIYISRVLQKFFDAFGEYVTSLYSRLIYLIPIVLIIFSNLFFRLYIILKGINYYNIDLNIRMKEIFIFFLIAASIMIAGVVSTGILIHFDPRYLESFATFFLGALFTLIWPIKFKNV